MTRHKTIFKCKNCGHTIRNESILGEGNFYHYKYINTIYPEHVNTHTCTIRHCGCDKPELGE